MQSSANENNSAKRRQQFKSFMQILKRSGEIRDACGTPNVILTGEEMKFLYFSTWNILVINEFSHGR